MKKLIYGGLLLAAVGIGFVGCEKEEEFYTNSSNFTKLNYNLDNISILHTSEGESNVNMEDKDEIKLNKQLKDLAEATRELTKEFNFNSMIIELAQKSGTQTVYYSQLKEVAPSYYARINSNLRKKGSSIETITENMTHEPINPNPKYPETEELEVYEPAIMVPNTEIIDPKKIPLISPNVEKVYNNEVFIKCWFFKETGALDSTLINEETTFKTGNPIFILNHSMPYANMKRLGDFLKSNEQDTYSSTTKSNTSAKVSQVEVKRNHGYEQGAFNWDSEFAINAMVTYSNGPSNFIYLFRKGVNKDKSLKIAEVREREIKNVDFIFSPDYSTNTNYVAVYWNTFERDWNRSQIDLGHSASSDPYYWAMGGRARYSGDWYQWIPNTTRIHQFPYHWFGWETSIKFDNWKSSITVKPN